MSERDPIADAWSAQTLDCLEFDMDKVKRDAAAFERSVRWTVIRELAASVVVVLAFGTYVVVLSDPFVRLASAAIVLITLALVRGLLRFRGSPAPNPSLATTAYLEAQREQMLRTATLLEQVPLRYLLPFYLAFSTFVVAVGHANPVGPDGKGISSATTLFMLSLGTVFHAAIAAGNVWSARKIRAKVAEQRALRD